MRIYLPTVLFAVAATLLLLFTDHCVYGNSYSCESVTLVTDPYFCPLALENDVLNDMETVAKCVLDQLLYQEDIQAESNGIAYSKRIGIARSNLNGARRRTGKCRYCETKCPPGFKSSKCINCPFLCKRRRRLEQDTENQSATSSIQESSRVSNSRTVDQKVQATDKKSCTPLSGPMTHVDYYATLGLIRRKLFDECRPCAHPIISDSCLDHMILLHTTDCRFIQDSARIVNGGIPPVTGLTLIDNTRHSMGHLSDGMEIRLGSYTIRAETNGTPYAVELVLESSDTNDKNIDEFHTDKSFPYTMHIDQFAFEKSMGKYTLKVTPIDAKGNRGETFQVTFRLGASRG